MKGGQQWRLHCIFHVFHLNSYVKGHYMKQLLKVYLIITEALT